MFLYVGRPRHAQVPDYCLGRLPAPSHLHAVSSMRLQSPFRQPGPLVGYASCMSETVMITGGTGFIGRHLCADLLAGGWQVEVLTRDIDRARRVLPQAAGAVSRPEDARSPAAIINLAGENLSSGRWSTARKRELRQSRLDRKSTRL